MRSHHPCRAPPPGGQPVSKPVSPAPVYAYGQSGYPAFCRTKVPAVSPGLVVCPVPAVEQHWLAAVERGFQGRSGFRAPRVHPKSHRFDRVPEQPATPSTDDVDPVAGVLVDWHRLAVPQPMAVRFAGLERVVLRSYANLFLNINYGMRMPSPTTRGRGPGVN
jgi:hypothetical protein